MTAAEQLRAAGYRVSAATEKKLLQLLEIDANEAAAAAPSLDERPIIQPQVDLYAADARDAARWRYLRAKGFVIDYDITVQERQGDEADRWIDRERAIDAIARENDGHVDPDAVRERIASFGSRVSRP